jgi:hypothetical protein
MSKARYTAEQILEDLDTHAADYRFPMLDNGYIYPGDVRLTAYRDNRRWAILIENLGYHYKLGFPDGIFPSIYVAGNGRIADPPDFDPQPFSCVIDEDREFIGDIPSDLKEVFIRGQPVPIPREKSVYEAKGIAVADVKELGGQHILRVLLPEYREALLATEEELRRYVAPDLPRFRRLDAWHHPDLANDEMPSQNETFQLLAEALVAGNPNRYPLVRPPNTHWKNWPMGGAL